MGLGTVAALIKAMTKKTEKTVAELKNEIHGLVVTPEMYGAKGDGVTDDSQAIQAAVNAGYNIQFGDNKTYFLASQVSINHDCHLYGGENTTIKTESVTEGGTTTLNKAFVVSGSLKKTTTLTTNYYENGNTDNSSNKFTLADMENINVGDLMEIVAEDQFYSYARPYYYLGGMLLVSEVRDGHIYTSTSLPFSIENTVNVTVKIYNAPEVHIENLHFVSDRARVRFVFFVDFIRCKNSTIKNCEMTEAWNFVRFYRCFNSLADCITASKSKYDNSLGVDSYAICIESCTNTIIQRINGICGQDCISLTGTFPVINTYIRNCSVAGECRPVGIGLHENTYNIVIEDCDVGGISLYGTAKVNRCRIIINNRVGGDFGIVLRGSHNEKYAKFEINECVFARQNAGFISIGTQAPEEPIQSYDNIIGELIIRNCEGGFLRADLSDSPAAILSNVVKRLIIDNWNNCYEIFHKSVVFEYVDIKDTNFITRYWINKHTDATDISDIRLMRVSSKNPMFERLYVDNVKNGGRYIIPSGVAITLSSLDNSAHYTVCGKNIMPNDPTELSVGSVSGSVGENLTRVVDANFSSALSADNGCLVYTQPNNTTKKYVYMKSFAYVEEDAAALFSVKIKNVGSTDPATWKAYFARVDSATGKILFRDAKGTATASDDGTTLSFNHGVYKGDLVLFYMYCSTPVANAVTKFENYMASLRPYGYGFSTPQFEEYDGVSRDGDGVLISRDGINNILSSASSFEAKFGAELFI